MRRWFTMRNPVGTKVGVLAIAARMVAFVALFGLSFPADAADHPINSEADLRTAITTAADADTITFNVDATLTQDLPAIQTNATLLAMVVLLSGLRQRPAE